MELFYISGNENPKKISYIFSKESCSYISKNRNPPKIIYILGNRTFCISGGTSKAPKSKFLTFFQKKL